MAVDSCHVAGGIPEAVDTPEAEDIPEVGRMVPADRGLGEDGDLEGVEDREL